MAKKSKRVLGFVFISMLVFSVSAIDASEKKVSWGSVGIPETLDPGQAWDNSSVFFTVNLYDTLVRLDPETSDIVPSLAVSWEMRNNGTLWEFNLRKDVRFHDGTEFNADSVVFSFQRQMDRDSPYHYYDFPLYDEIFRNVVSVESVDSHTVLFRLNEPFYPFLATLTSSPAAIVSPTAVKLYGKAFARNPVGTGPFKFKSWGEDNRIVLEANPDYWRGKPGFDRFCRFTTDKHERLHKMFREEQIDIIDSYSISRTAGLRNLRWATVKLVPILSVTFISFNLGNPLLKSENIRKAICYAWDPRFLKYVFQDFVTPLTSVVPAGMPGYKAAKPEFKFDMKKARNWIEKEMPRSPIRIRFLLIRDSSLERQLISLFSKNLKRIGIELQIVSVSLEEFNRKIGKGDFDLTIYSWIADYPDPQSIISPLFNEQLMKKGFPNLSQYPDPEMKAQIESLSSEMDKSQRIQKVTDIIKKIDTLTLCIPIFQNTSVIIFNNKRIKNIAVTPMETIHLFDIEKK